MNISKSKARKVAAIHKCLRVAVEDWIYCKDVEQAEKRLNKLSKKLYRRLQQIEKEER